MNNYKPKKMISVIVLVSLFLTLIFLANSAQATAVVIEPTDPMHQDEEPVNQEDFDIPKEYGDQLTKEQLATLEAAFAQMKESITSAESIYQDAIKALKEKYRSTVQSAVKSAEGDTELAAVIEQLKVAILAEYEEIQSILNSAVSSARDSFRKTADAAMISSDIIETIAAWHVNKQLNASTELTDFVEAFRGALGNMGNAKDEDKAENPGQGESQSQGQGSSGETPGQQMSEENREKNQNQNVTMNKEQEKQAEQEQENKQEEQIDDDHDDDDNKQDSENQSQKQGQTQGNAQSSNGKGKK